MTIRVRKDGVQGGLEMAEAYWVISVFTMNYETRLLFPSEDEEGRQIAFGERRYELLEYGKI